MYIYIAYYPDLVDLMEFIRFDASRDDDANNDAFYDPAEISYWSR
jgi:hypothetical protein